MSLCSNTLRAQLRRARIPRSQTLLPFLYQTPTIQQWGPCSRPAIRRYASSWPDLEDSIPFEGLEADLPPAVDDAASTHKTTMTATERAAFEKLYKTFNTQGQGRSTGNKGEHEELDQIADEYYEDDEDTSGKSLDKVFDAVLQGSLRPQKLQQEAPSTTLSRIRAAPEPAKPETVQSKKKSDAKAARDELKRIELSERARIRLFLSNAQTDRDLWNVLTREVFDPIRNLDLDGTSSKATTKKSKAKSRASDSTEKRVLFANYPNLLVYAVLILRQHFPTSQYILLILPTMKSLGRSSYALGASTNLYRYLLRTAWVQQSSYAMMDTLLQDMETNAIEFDAGTLEVLDGVLKEHKMARSGELGTALQLAHDLEQWSEGIKKIREWRDHVAEKLHISTEPAPAFRVRAPVHRQRPVARWNDWSHRVDRREDGQRARQVGRERRTGDTIPIVRDALTTVQDEADSEPTESANEEHAGIIEIEDTEKPAKILL